MNSKTKCLVCGHFLTTEEYEDGEPRICVTCWKCPKCEVGARTKGDDEGLILYDEETVICRPCDTGWSFKKFENALVKKANLVTCPTCKGKGTVAGKKG
jgi:hypothetical protein